MKPRKTKIDLAIKEVEESPITWVVTEFDDVLVNIPGKEHPVDLRSGEVKHYINQRMLKKYGKMASNKTWTKIYQILTWKAHHALEQQKNDVEEKRNLTINNLIKYIKENKTTNYAMRGYKLTKEFCKRHAIDSKPLLKWLHKNGGFSDYYILKNLDKPEEPSI